MDNLAFLLGFENLQDSIRVLQQNQMMKQNINYGNNNDAPTTFPQSYSPSQNGSVQSLGFSPSIKPLMMNSESSATRKNNFQSGSLVDNMILSLEKAAEVHNKQQRQLIEHIAIQHDQLIQTIDGLAQDKEKLEKKVEELEFLVQEKLKSRQHSPKEIPKKNRRRIEEINRIYNCPYENCQKKYGSDISMNLHIKLKHNGGNKTEREQLAVNSLSQNTQPSPAPSF